MKTYLIFFHTLWVAWRLMQRILWCKVGESVKMIRTSAWWTQTKIVCRPQEPEKHQQNSMVQSSGWIFTNRLIFRLRVASGWSPKLLTFGHRPSPYQLLIWTPDSGVNVFRFKLLEQIYDFISESPNLQLLLKVLVLPISIYNLSGQV